MHAQSMLRLGSIRLTIYKRQQPHMQHSEATLNMYEKDHSRLVEIETIPLNQYVQFVKHIATLSYSNDCFEKSPHDSLFERQAGQSNH